MSGPEFQRGIRRLAERYDTFIVDLWGTLHDGVRAYPGAADVLARLKARGKTVALLSNAPKRAAFTAAILDSVGIPADLYDVLLTSGEAVHIALRDRPDDWHRRLEGPCWLLGSLRDRSLFEGLDIVIKDHPEGAGFCVVTGTRMAYERVEDYKPELDQALAAGLPMICANPDIVVPAGDVLVICAGAFAQYYEGKGGDVYWHGKPRRPVYDRLFAALGVLAGEPVDLARTIAVGDALATDIAGAETAGVAGALLTSGIHRSELRMGWFGRPNQKMLAALAKTYGAEPDYVLPRFVW
jgi:HAD superfamily hydrolase (TIGR01459 family)